MTLEGDIQELQLIRRLLELAKERFTGAIRFENVSILKILYFKDGELLSASTNDRSDSVDEILLRSGKVSRDHLKEALAKRQPEESLGEALLSLGFITKKELSWARRVQLVGVLRSLHGWTNGTFAIVPDYLPKRQEGTSFKIQQIIVELLVTSDDRSAIERQLDGGEVVLEREFAFEVDYPTLDLNDEADAIVTLIDGTRSASEIASESHRDFFTVYKLLAALQTLGLLRESTTPKAFLEVQPSLEIPTMPVSQEAFSFGTIDFESLPSAVEEPDTESADAPAIVSDMEQEKRSRRIALPLIAVALVAIAGGVGFVFKDRIAAAFGGGDDVSVAGIAAPVSVESQESPGTAPDAETIAEPAAVAAETAPAVLQPEPAAVAAPETRVTRQEPVVEKPKAPQPDVAPSAPKPAAVPAAATAEPSSDPLRRRYDSMAAEFARKQEKGRFTVQFELVCQTESVTRALEGGGSQVWFVPTSFRGRSCFRVFWGDYATRSEAEAAVGTIPASLKGTSKPAVIELR